MGDTSARHEGDVPLHRVTAHQDHQAGQSYASLLLTLGVYRGRGSTGGTVAQGGGADAPFQLAAQLHPLPDNLGEELDAASYAFGFDKREVQAHAVLARTAGVKPLTRHVRHVFRYRPG